MIKEWIKNLMEKIGINEEALIRKPKEIKIGKRKKSPPYESMTKKELETYTQENFNVDLDLRHNKKLLVNQVQKLARGK